MFTLHFFRSTLSVCLFAIAFLLTGCALQTSSPISPVPGTAFSGVVHGGQQPIANARVYLLAVNTTGYGGPGIAASAANASLSLLTSAVPGSQSDSIGYYTLTGADGSFHVTGDYSCTTGYSQNSGTAVTLPGSQQVYLYVAGGKPIVDSPTANNSIGLLAALGSCSSPTTKVTINEIATVGTAYAFAGFASDATHISVSGTALSLTGLNNAFNNVSNLVNISTGTVATGTLAGNGTVPAGSINTIANIMAACVNSDGSGTSPCTTIFPYMQASGNTGGLPSDTASAAINLAHNPYPTAAGVAALYSTIPALGAPFSGALGQQPHDFTLTIAFSGGNLSNPKALAVDNLGDVWIVNAGNSTIAEASPAGAYITTSYTGTGISSPTSLAIDTVGYIWVGYKGGINKISPSNPHFATNFFPLGTDQTSGIAIDPYGHIIFVSGSGYIGELDSSGNNLLQDLNPPQIQYNPTSVAVDAGNNVWVGSASGPMTQFVTYPTYFGYQSAVPTVNNVNSVALDPSSNVYAASSILNYTIYDYMPVTNTATSYAVGTATAPPTAIAIDSAGSSWVVTPGLLSSGNTVSKYSSTGVSLSGAGFQGNGSYSGPSAIAIDGSGNVWTVNAGTNNLVEMIGSAAPVATPLAINVTSPYTHPASLP